MSSGSELGSVSLGRRAFGVLGPIGGHLQHGFTHLSRAGVRIRSGLRARARTRTRTRAMLGRWLLSLPRVG